MKNGGANAFGGSNLPLKGDKGDLWEGGTRVPGFITFPGQEQNLVRKRLSDTFILCCFALSGKNSVCFSLHHVTDWFPTLINAAGGSLEDLGIAPLDGVDQWESLQEGSEGARTEMLYNIADQVGLAPSAAIRYWV